MADDNFDPKKIIEALRAKGIPDSEIKKLYPNFDFGEDQKKSQQRQQKTKKPKEPKEPKKTWSTTDNERLKKMFANGYSPEELANEFGTSPKQVIDQVEKLKKNGWDGATPITPEQRLANKRKFERLRNATGKTGRAVGKGIYKGASKLNEHFGGAAAANIEKNFGLLGRGFNRLTGLGYSKIDEESLKGKLKKEESGGSGVSVEALNKTTAIIIGSISNLNHSISHGTSLLGRVIGKATSKVIDKISNIESVVKKLNYTKIVRQRKEDMLGGGNGLGGKSSFAKMALVGGVALASGMALNALLPEDKADEETPSDAEKKPKLESKKNSDIGTNNDGSSEELRIKASEIKFNAKDIEFEYDKLTMEGRDFAQGKKADSGGASGSWEPQQESSTDTKSDKLGSDSVFPNPNGLNPKTELGGLGNTRTFNSRFDGITGATERVTAGFEDVRNPFNPKNLSAPGLEEGRNAVSEGLGVSKEFVPNWAASGQFQNKGQTLPDKNPLYSSHYADERQKKFGAELENQDIRYQIAAMNMMEGNNTAVLESLANRSSLMGSTLHGALHNGFYGPINRGRLGAEVEKLKRNPALFKKQNAMIDEVFKRGKNQIHGFTDQGMPTDPNGSLRGNNGPMMKIGGNEFSDWGNKNKSSKWRQENEAAAARRFRQESVARPFEKQNSIPFLNPNQTSPLDKPKLLDPTIDKGSKLNNLEIETQTTPSRPITKEPERQNEPKSPLPQDKTFFESVLETQGPNHFAESGFPDGNLGILS